MFWDNEFFGDSVFSDMKVDDREISNSLLSNMQSVQYDCAKMSGFFHIENILDEFNDEIYYYDVWFFAGNLTNGEFLTL